jgi:N6-adenosine-specific RNA methylase IME4
MQKILSQQEATGRTLVNARAEASVEVSELYHLSLRLAQEMAQLEALDRRCLQLGVFRKTIAGDPTAWKTVAGKLKRTS